MHSVNPPDVGVKCFLQGRHESPEAQAAEIEDYVPYVSIKERKKTQVSIQDDAVYICT